MENNVMPLIQHLEELRKVIIRSLMAFGITLVAGWWFRNDVMRFLVLPITDKGYKLVYLTPLEPFYTELKLAVIAGFVLALPFILWEVWGFLLPALKPAEKKYVKVIVVFSLLQFLLGITFAFFTVFKIGINFFLEIGRDAAAVPTLSMGNYLSFVASFIIPFGLFFELPLVMIFLAKIGVVNPEVFAKNRKYAILLICIAAGILTPGPDVLSQLLMSVPLYLLYEVSVVISKFFFSNRKGTTDYQSLCSEG
jgi:sec-independent protein translocase protein TatC